MSVLIRPESWCVRCRRRPRVQNGELCVTCEAQEVGLANIRNAREVVTGEAVAKLPRCVAYLSRTDDVITLELTGEPRFTEADVEIVAAALGRRRS